MAEWAEGPKVDVVPEGEPWQTFDGLKPHRVMFMVGKSVPGQLVDEPVEAGSCKITDCPKCGSKPNRWSARYTQPPVLVMFAAKFFCPNGHEWIEMADPPEAVG
jgi:hypothetical protein